MITRIIFFLLMLPLTTHAQVVGSLGVKGELCDDGCGLVITKVHPTSAAKSIGLRRGDIIIQLNGMDINNPYDLSDFKDFIVNNPGMIVSLTIVRDGRIATRDVLLDTLPYLPDQSPSNPMPRMPSPSPPMLSADQDNDAAPPLGTTVINNYYGDMKHNITNQNGNGNAANQNNQR